MMGKTHSITGVVLWAGVGPLVAPDLTMLALGFIPAVVLPYGADLDHPNSTASRKLWGPLHRTVGNLVARLSGGHRHGLHSIWAILIAAALGYWLGGTPWAWAAGLGWSGGILGDLLTKSRVHFFWPLWNGKVGLPLAETGRWSEALFNILQIGAGVALVYHHIA